MSGNSDTLSPEFSACFSESGFRAVMHSETKVDKTALYFRLLRGSLQICGSVT